MPFDVIGYLEATPGTGDVFLAAALQDRIYSAVLDDITLNSDITQLLGCYAAAVSTGALVRVRQPKLNGIDHMFHKVMLEADNDPTQGFTSLLDNPLPLIPNEKCNVLIRNATDESALVALLVGNEKLPRVCNPTHCITGYGDTTLTALTWTQAAMTWEHDLPYGEYAVVGMRAGVFKAAAPLAAVARLVLPGKSWRPGVPMAIMEADHEEYQSVTDEPWAVWGLMKDISFHSTRMPSIECLSNAAHTDENVELLLQKLS